MKYLLMISLSLVCLFSLTLEELDGQRLQIKEGSLRVDINSVNKRGKKTSKSYNILRKDRANSLVVFAHESEKGTVVVKEQNNLYIKTGRSSRAIRISPIQRLVGDASVGDILDISFQSNYKIDKKENEILFLKAIDDKSTYASMKVYTKNKKLIKADLFSYSGKMLKTIFYEYANNSKKINQYRFVSRKGEAIAIMSDYKDIKLANKLFKKRNVKNLYQFSKKYFK